MKNSIIILTIIFFFGTSAFAQKVEMTIGDPIIVNELVNKKESEI